MEKPSKNNRCPSRGAPVFCPTVLESLGLSNPSENPSCTSLPEIDEMGIGTSINKTSFVIKAEQAKKDCQKTTKECPCVEEMEATLERAIGLQQVMESGIESGVLTDDPDHALRNLYWPYKLRKERWFLSRRATYWSRYWSRKCDKNKRQGAQHE
ncbi:hypothetical protein FWC31_00060 [Candidatus Saccharibacteria bacterium]|nr:hypothetical protein [Candidatus Saccharibacteria bacterium]